MTDYAFLHGGAQGGWVWAPVIAAMRGRGDRLLALDVPGCGEKRDRDTRMIGVDDIVAELIDDIEQAGFSDVILVGHSQAGSVMPAMARLRPALFQRLIYLTCSIPLPGQSIIEMMGSGIHGSNPDEVGWPSAERSANMRERARVQFCNDMNEAETTVFLGRLGKDNWPVASYRTHDWSGDSSPVPATYIICDRDQVLPVEWQERFAIRFGAQHVVHLDAGHQAMTSQPRRVAEILGRET